MVRIGKISSVLKNADLKESVEITDKIQSVEGEVVVVKALEERKKYGEIELSNGEMAKIEKGDVIAGVLGARKALEGIVGIVPKTLKVNDVIHVLNLGGVLGLAEDWNPDFVDSPLPVKVMGAILRDDATLTLSAFSLKTETVMKESSPVLLVLGSSMGVGKTTAVKEIISLLTKNGLKIAAGKLTGVATQRDMIMMREAGAVKALSFLDTGITSSMQKDSTIVQAANAIMNSLNKDKPDMIVIELGDGLLGWYGVDKLLQNKEFMAAVICVVGCANDLVGATGLCEVLKRFGKIIDFFAGPVTNNTAGTDYLEQFLQTAGQDLRYGQSRFVEMLSQKGVQIHD